MVEEDEGSIDFGEEWFDFLRLQLSRAKPLAIIFFFFIQVITSWWHFVLN